MRRSEGSVRLIVSHNANRYMTQIVILGAGEHGRMAAYCCRVLNYGVLGFLDDTKAVGAEINGVPVLGGFEVAEGEAFGDDVSFYVAVGDPAGRIAVYERLEQHSPRWNRYSDPLGG